MIILRKGNRAFSLIEVTLALGVAGFCLIALFGLLPSALNSDKTSSDETAATNILNSVVADVRQTPNPLNPAFNGLSTSSPYGTAQTTTIYGIGIPAAGGGGAPSVATVKNCYFGDGGNFGSSLTLPPNNEAARYLLSVWTTPGTGRQATIVRIVISWPAGQADVSKAQGSVEAVVALDRN